MHFGIAAIAHSPDIALDPEEAGKLAIASANVMRHYDIRTTQKTMDWIQLYIALGLVYAPRVAVLVAGKKKVVAPSAPAPNGAGNNPDMDYPIDAGLSPHIIQ